MERVRHTNLPLEKLIEDVRTMQGLTIVCRHVCNCFYVDEIGVMAHEGNNEAVAFLCEILLCHSTMLLRAISYGYLKTQPKPQEGTKKALAEFEADIKNTSLIQLVVDDLKQDGYLPEST